ncbi:MAG: bifunctional phosphopantothenoylcysteine decarboxylase/phosphopantothenate--cysteine ligase CoaBC [Candidatus Thermoplasmatota archaeon]|jgi:phosphopantothenoylcysteine decarboxylase/phosphopantothenate--cysteine ligase|nr:bifunctional phosphopantothenoylcysteine decarboxylase/phosphopantothenate--cysteine ligase CoaBC [Candidatus Thermoplasmatota archaeon]
MHPVNDIRGVRSSLLSGKRIVLAITGSIGAVECVKLSRELVRHGADVHAVMSPKACDIIHPYAMGFATGNPVITELTGGVEHVSLCGNVQGRADLVLLAPCTANTLGKMVHAVDDTPVTTFLTTAIGTGIPVLLVPAMHSTMYEHPTVRENLSKAVAMGVEVVDPSIEENKAKMAPVPMIVERVLRKLGRGRLRGDRVLIVTGATREPIDDMRFITNRASGATGIHLAIECYREGADVLMLAGENVEKVPQHIRTLRFSTTTDLQRKLSSPGERWGVPTVAFFCAGISDYAPQVEEGKIPSGKEELLIRMLPTPKLIDAYRRENPDCLMVGWKAESLDDEPEIARRAFRKLKNASLDMIVANALSGVTQDATTCLVIMRDSTAFRFSGPKMELAGFIIEKLLDSKKNGGKKVPWS